MARPPTAPPGLAAHDVPHAVGGTHQDRSAARGRRTWRYLAVAMAMAVRWGSRNHGKNGGKSLEQWGKTMVWHGVFPHFSPHFSHGFTFWRMGKKLWKLWSFETWVLVKVITTKVTKGYTFCGFFWWDIMAPSQKLETCTTMLPTHYLFANFCNAWDKLTQEREVHISWSLRSNFHRANAPTTNRWRLQMNRCGLSENVCRMPPIWRVF